MEASAWFLDHGDFFGATTPGGLFNIIRYNIILIFLNFVT